MIYQVHHRSVERDQLPSLLTPAKGKYGLRDYEKVFCKSEQAGQDIFSLRGIEKKTGCLIVVKPDQYVASVLPLDRTDLLTAFFEKILIPARN